MNDHDIKLVQATIEQKPILTKLFELYAYDFTEFFQYDISDEGIYGYDDMPLFWTDPNRFPYLVYVGNKIAGFVFVQKGSPISDDKEIWDMTQFFIMNKYKRLGIGSQVATQVWKLYRGRWQVRVLVCNHVACAFWLQAIQKFTQQVPAKRELVIHEPEGDLDWVVYSFET